MRPVLDEVPDGAHVAIIRLRSLGDCVLSTPAISLLKNARPDLRIAVVADSVWAAVYERNPDLSAVLNPSLKELRTWKPHLVLNLHGGTTSAKLTALSGARWRTGFSHFRHRFIYNLHIPRAQEILHVTRTVHTAEHAASAVFALGVPVQEIPRARVFADAPPPARQAYAVIHAVASEPAKIWPADRFLTFASFLQQELGLKPVFVGAPGDHLRAFQAFQIAQGLSLAETKNLISGASLFFGNDSGPAHLAAAFGVPSTVLFGPSDAAIWGPWRTSSNVLQAKPISEISVTQAMEAVGQLVTAGARS